MFRALARAFGQIGDRAMLAVLVGSILASGLGFVGLAALIGWAIRAEAASHGVLARFATLAGGVLATLSAIWLFVPVAVAIGSLCLEPVARAVERRWYPDRTPAHPASIIDQVRDGAVLGGAVLGLSLLALVLTLALPGIGLVLGWAVTAWAIGRGMFVSVAMRRMTRPEALALYRSRRGAALLEGALLALIAALPPLNLLLAALAPAAMVHLVERRAARE